MGIPKGVRLVIELSIEYIRLYALVSRDFAIGQMISTLP